MEGSPGGIVHAYHKGGKKKHEKKPVRVEKKPVRVKKKSTKAEKKPLRVEKKLVHIKGGKETIRVKKKPSPPRLWRR